jgi:outer membrane protein TolC
VNQNRTQLDQTIIAFNRAVLQAMQEVSNVMSTYTHSIEQMVATRQALNYSQQALALSLDLYKQGLTTFQSVLDAQRSLLSSEESLVQARGYSLTTLVQMYQALGGGWR